jgi:hypothetical protein
LWSKCFAVFLIICVYVHAIEGVYTVSWSLFRWLCCLLMRLSNLHLKRKEKKILNWNWNDWGEEKLYGVFDIMI